MPGAAEIFYCLLYLAAGCVLSYCAGWLFSKAIDEIERLDGFIMKIMNGG